MAIASFVLHEDYDQVRKLLKICLKKLQAAQAWEGQDLTPAEKAFIAKAEEAVKKGE